MRLETDRLVIRPFRHDDLEACCRLFSEPGFMAGVPGGALDRAATAAKLEATIGYHREYGHAKMAVLDRAVGRLIGTCGIGLAEIEGELIPELGYRLTAAARGRGLATEAARAVLADAFERLEMAAVHAVVLPDNAPSRRVLAKLGFAYLRPVDYCGGRWLLHRAAPPVAGPRSPE